MTVLERAEFSPANISSDQCAGTLFYTTEEATTFRQALDNVGEVPGVYVDELTNSEDPDKLRTLACEWQGLVCIQQATRDMKEGIVVRGQLEAKIDYIECIKRYGVFLVDAMISRGKTRVYRYITDAKRNGLDMLLTEYENLQQARKV